MRVIAGKFREEKIIIKVWIGVILLFLGLLAYFQIGEENLIFNARKSAETIYSEQVQRVDGVDVDAPIGVVNYKLIV